MTTDRPAKSPWLMAIEFLREMRLLDEEMPAHHAEVFLVLVREPGLSQKEVRMRCGLERSTVSRIYQKLGDGPDGLQLLQIYPCPADARAKRARLTAKGKALADRVFDIWLD